MTVVRAVYSKQSMLYGCAFGYKGCIRGGGGGNSSACVPPPHVMYPGMQMPFPVGKASSFQRVFSGGGAFSITSLQRGR